jgi:hypothetical protein
MSTAPGVCPVCGARFRGSSTCTRCGADLAPLMALLVESRRLREEARESLSAGRAREAAALARAALDLHATPAGAALRDLAEWVEFGNPVKEGVAGGK